MNERSDTRLRFVLGLGAVAVAFGLIWIALTAPYGIPLRDRYSLEVHFDDAATLPNHAPVRIAGRLVGQAQSPRAVDGQAVFDLELDPEIAPLRAGTRVRVRPLGLLGQQYLDLIPAARGAPLADGDVIPAEDASASVRLPEVLATLDAPRRRQLRRVTRAFGAGFLDRGDDLGEILERGPRTLRALGELSGALTGDGDPPRRLVRGLDALARGLEPVRGDLAAGFEPGARALKPLDEHRDTLGAALAEAPGALAGLNRDLARVDPLLDELGTLGERLTPLLHEAPAALNELDVLLREGDGPVARAEELLAGLEAAAPSTSELAGALGLQVPRLDRQLEHVLPSLGRLAKRECDLRLFGENWSSMLGFGYEGGGEIGNLGMIRFLVIASPESLSGVPGGLPGIRKNPYPAPCEAGTELDG